MKITHYSLEEVFPALTLLSAKKERLCVPATVAPQKPWTQLLFQLGSVSYHFWLGNPPLGEQSGEV